MKKVLSFVAAATILLSAASLIACNNKDNDAPNKTINIEKLFGTWRYYWASGSHDTLVFYPSGYGEFYEDMYGPYPIRWVYTPDKSIFEYIFIDEGYSKGPFRILKLNDTELVLKRIYYNQDSADEPETMRYIRII